MLYILFRNDDPCALSDPAHERRVFELFEKYNIPLVTAVVPKMVDDPHNWESSNYTWLHENPTMVELLREYHLKGVTEIAQHGFVHQTNRFRTSVPNDNGEADFQGIDRLWSPYLPPKKWYSEFAQLPIDEQRAKIAAGKKYLEELLETSIETFVFPWNTYDENSLRVLKENHFNVVAAGYNPLRTKDINVIPAYNWDVNQYPDLVKIFSKHKKVFIQLGFHSWMLDEQNMRALEETLQIIQQRENIMCLTASQIPKVLPELKRVFPFSARKEILSQKIHALLNIERPEKENCDLRIRHYLKKITIYEIMYFILKHIGFDKLFKASLILLFISITASLFHYQHAGNISLLGFLSVIILGGISNVSLLAAQRLRMLRYFS